jgi:phage terminase large subunit GpA-like protein
MNAINLTIKQKDILRELFKELKPKPKINVLEFSKKYGILSAENSAITGRFTPIKYQEDILLDGSNSDIDLLVFMKSTRVGYTTILKFIIAYHIAENPCPQLVFQPSDKKANEFSKKELEPLIRAMKVVSSKLIKSRQDNTQNYKRYVGGFISSLGGQTPNNYASATAKIVMGDEYDRFPHDVGKEGDPAELMEKRMESFWDGKLILGSTPTGEDSKINKQFKRTDMMYRYVPCPHCGSYQIIEFKNIQWDKEVRQGVYTELPYTAKLKCISCSKMIDHKQKRQMDNQGQWRQTQVFFCCNEWQDPKITLSWKNLNLDGEQDSKGYAVCYKCNKPAEYNTLNKRKRGYHINACYSFQPNSTWQTLATKFIEAKGNEEKMRTFKNTWLGEIFEQKRIKLSNSKLLSQTEDYTKVPLEQEVLIMSVDTQKTWLQWTVKAWCKGETSYGIAQGKIEGDTSQRFVWDKLYNISNIRYTLQDNSETCIYLCLIDSGGIGSTTETVYNFVLREECLNSPTTKYLAIKGEGNKTEDNSVREIITESKNKNVNAPLFLIAVNKCKDIIYDRLKLKKDDFGYMHYNKNFDEEYFKQLTSEEIKFTKNKRGYLVQEYVKTRDRNEALDLEVYNLAGIKLLQKENLLDLSM